jgi:[acyl-carrier-protein] S-malonyltransferase
VQPDLLAGHSLGEISVLACSGAVTFADALRIAHAREQLMTSVNSELGGMIAVMGAKHDEAQKICEYVTQQIGYIAVSNFNSDEQMTLSGTNAAVAEAGKRLKEAGALVLPLPMPGPYHSRLMEAAVPKMREALRPYTFHPFQVPVVSSITGRRYESAEEIHEQLALQLVSPVVWTDVLARIASEGIGALIEVSPQMVLRNLSMTNELDLQVYAVDHPKDFQELLRLFSPVSLMDTVDDSRKENLLHSCLKEAVCVPNFNPDEQAYELEALPPFRDALALQKELHTNRRPPSYKELKDGLEMLHQVLAAKQVPEQERREIMEDILYASGLFDCYSSYLAV